MPEKHGYQWERIAAYPRVHRMLAAAEEGALIWGNDDFWLSLLLVRHGLADFQHSKLRITDAGKRALTVPQRSFVPHGKRKEWHEQR